MIYGKFFPVCTLKISATLVLFLAEDSTNPWFQSRVTVAYKNKSFKAFGFKRRCHQARTFYLWINGPVGKI